MQVTINGELLNFNEPLSVAAFLNSKEIIPESVVVELNGKIVPEEKRDETVLADGDHIEILQFVGGG